LARQSLLASSADKAGLRYYDFRDEILTASCADDEGGPWDDLNERAFSVVKPILAHKATTPAGLKVQTRALMLTNSELWHAPWTVEDASERIPSYFRSVCNVLGLALPPDIMFA